MKISEFVDEARSELYQGWVQGAYSNGQGVCVLGALDRVAMRHLSEDGIRARALAQQEIQAKAAEMFPDVFSGSIPSLNDNHLTTKDDMLSLMDKVTISLEEVGK